MKANENTKLHKAATLIGERKEEKIKEGIRDKWDETHLCENYNGERCEYLVEAKDDTVLNGKKLDSWCLYCTSENKIRKIGSAEMWTGLSPKFCPKRKASENKEDKEMTPNFNFKGFISEGNQLKQVPLDMLIPYHNHKFKLYEGERLEDMVNSVKANGVLTPIIVRAVDDGEKYEILAGHNRTNAARLAGLTVIPAVVKENLTDDEAEMYVIETNVMQRGFDDLSITERAAVVAARHSAMFDEDKRKAIERELAILNGEEVEEQEDDTDDEKKSKLAAVGENYGLGKDSVARLLRIDKLVDELKPFVDSGVIAIRAAVNLSYLFVSEQRKVAENMDVDFGMDMKKSAVLREVSKQNKLNDSAIREIMMYGNLAAEGDLAAEGEVPTTRKPIKVKISTDICDRYFAPDWDNKKVQEIIELALEQYFNKSTSSDDTDRFIMDDEDKYQI